MKKFLVSSLACVFLLNTDLVFGSKKPLIQDVNNVVSVVEIQEVKEDTLLDTRHNYLIIDREVISTSGRQWTQPRNYPYFRASITNTQNQTLNVTFTTSSGSTFRETVPANSTRNFVGSNVPNGRTRVDFSTANGNVTGIISVRVSSLPL